MAHLPIPATDTPMGFLPVGAPETLSPYVTDSSVAAIYRGDMVLLEADGALGVATANAVNCVGAAAQYQGASIANNLFLVYDDVLQRFMAQDDGDTGIMTATSVGANASIVTTTGSTTLLTSNQEIDSSTAFTTSTLALKIIALHPNEAFSYATTVAQQRKWICSLNNHLLAPYQQLGI